MFPLSLRHPQDGHCQPDGARDELDHDADRPSNSGPAHPHVPHILYDRHGRDIWRLYGHLLAGRRHGPQEPGDDLPDPGLVAARQGDRGERVRCRLHLPHARARLSAVPDPALHLHKAVRALPQQEVVDCTHPVHVRGRHQGELPEPHGHTRPADIRAGPAGGR